MSETNQLVRREIPLEPTNPKNASSHIGGTETTPITVRRTSYTDNYPRFLADSVILRRPPWISMNTTCHIINGLCILSLNVMVVLFYDEDTFQRADIFWSIFGFSSIALMTRFRNYIVSILSEMAMTALYLWFCDWDWTLLIVFCSLLFVMFCCKLLPRIGMRFCSDSSRYIIHQTVTKIENNLGKEGCGLECHGDGIFIAFTTVPMFYFNQSFVSFVFIHLFPSNDLNN